MMGEYLNDIYGAPTEADCRLAAKKKNKRITIEDIESELQEQCYWGQLVCIIMQIPDEMQVENIPYVDIYSPEGACKTLAWHLGWKVFDQNGKEQKNTHVAHYD